LVYIDKAIKLSINNDIYKLLKSEIYINKSNIDEALYILEDLNNNRIKKDSNKEIRINILLADALLKKRKYEEAEIILLKLIKKYQGLELAYLNLSILLIFRQTTCYLIHQWINLFLWMNVLLLIPQLFLRVS